MCVTRRAPVHAGSEPLRDPRPSAQVLLLATGAGWSADSGLAVYRDIADVPAYHELGLTYRDICQPRWLSHDPELFFGKNPTTSEIDAADGIDYAYRAE